jgi:hypothetical protein
VQIDPIKPTLTAPGTKRLKLKHDELFSNFAFKFNLRRHNEATFTADAVGAQIGDVDDDEAGGSLRTSTR